MKHPSHDRHINEINQAALVEEFNAIGITLSLAQIAQFKLYHSEILKSNGRIKLVSKGDESRIVPRHFVESAALAKLSHLDGSRNLLDLGTGAGFPGLPLKLVRPELSMTLLDSKRLKAIFLRRLIQKLELANVSVICERAEEASLKVENSHVFDLILMRAVAQLHIIYELALPFLRPEGRLLAVKGSGLEDELALLRARRPGVTIAVEPHPIRLNGRPSKLHVVILESMDALSA